MRGLKFDGVEFKPSRGAHLGRRPQCAGARFRRKFDFDFKHCRPNVAAKRCRRDGQARALGPCRAGAREGAPRQSRTRCTIRTKCGVFCDYKPLTTEILMAANLNQPPPGDTPEGLRRTIRDHGTWSEDRAVKRLLHNLELTGGARHRAVTVAMGLVEGARARRDERPFLDAFLQEFGLSNQEGIALMCIAEALLRIPDDATADRLIAEKLATGDWSSHAGKSESLFVNASTWGLMLTGGILELDPAIKTDTTGWMRKFTRKAGQPLVRLGVRRAMRIIGGELGVGRSIEGAVARGAP